MISWVFWFAVILAPSIIGLTFAVRAARRVTKVERAMRVLAARPGWQRLERDKDGAEWAGYAGHFPWLLSARLRTTAAGPLGGHQVTVGRLVKSVSSKTDAHWLVVCFDFPHSGASLRLERRWSAAQLGLPVPKDVPYLPMSGDLEATADRLSATDLVERLGKLAGPAVSLGDDQVCFVYFPLPEVVDMDRLLEGLAALLPDLTGLARAASSPKGETDGA